MSDLDLKRLFGDWLKEKGDELQSKQSKLAFAYFKAADQIKLQTDTIATPKQLKSIKGVGEKIFQFLCKKLQKHCVSEDLDIPPEFENYTADEVGGKKKLDLDEEDKPKKRRKLNWVPKRRSGGYAILISLYENDRTRRGIRKEDIIAGATQYCDTSFSKNPAARDFYSAWDGIKTLLKRDLVLCVGRAPQNYLLTDEGEALAKVLMSQEGITVESSESVPEEAEITFDNGVRLTPELNSVRPLHLLQELKETLELFVTPSSPLAKPPKVAHDREKRIFQDVKYDIWTPEEFDIVLLIDNREVRSRDERDFFQRRTQERNVTCEVRNLSVGDVLWIARHKKTRREVVLNYVCERKRLDDLASSIKDGRFVEQKNRLRKSGVRNVYYLVEESGLADVERIIQMQKAIETSILMVITVSNIFLQRFRKIDDTTDWLVSMTGILEQHYSTKKLVVLKPQFVNSQSEYLELLESFRAEFESAQKSYECVHTVAVYQASLGKTNMMTVKEMFILMLMLVKGISLEKAVVIQNHFGTPKKLMEYFLENQDLGDSDKSQLMFNLFSSQIGGKKLNKAALLAIYEAWGKE